MILTAIYPAGEPPIPGVSSDILVRALQKNGVRASLLHGNKVKYLRSYLDSETIFLTLGAGDVWKIGEDLFASRRR